MGSFTHFHRKCICLLNSFDCVWKSIDSIISIIYIFHFIEDFLFPYKILTKVSAAWLNTRMIEFSNIFIISILLSVNWIWKPDLAIYRILYSVLSYRVFSVFLSRTKEMKIQRGKISLVLCLHSNTTRIQWVYYL